MILKGKNDPSTQGNLKNKVRYPHNNAKTTTLIFSSKVFRIFDNSQNIKERFLIVFIITRILRGFIVSGAQKSTTTAFDSADNFFIDVGWRDAG